MFRPSPSSLATCSHIGMVCWHAFLRCSVKHPCQLSSDNGVQTKSARRSPHARPLPLAPSLLSAACVRAPPLRRTELSHLPARMHSSPLCHRTEPSPPSLPPHVGPCCFYAIHDYRWRPPMHVICNRVMSASSKSSLPHRPHFSAISSVPSCLTPPLSPCVGPEVAPRLAQVHLHCR
jgi:hypothetical protein